MAWVESVSPSFRARHDDKLADEADRLLTALERLRGELAELFPRTIGEITVVMHGAPLSLTASNPLLALQRAATAPAARRYVAGWAGRRELHVLADRALAGRASGVAGSREMLRLTAPVLYARRVILENHQQLQSARAPRRLVAELRWAWLLDGAARWFAGQTSHARAAIARRLREGARPSFPPGLRDATLLGGTVIDLLVRERGEAAAAALATRLHPQGPRQALARAFGGVPLVHLEGAWRAHLSALAGAPER
jgi:hypothetical protein